MIRLTDASFHVSDSRRPIPPPLLVLYAGFIWLGMSKDMTEYELLDIALAYQDGWITHFMNFVTVFSAYLVCA